MDPGTKTGLFAALGVDASDALHVVYSNWMDGKLYYATCPDACATTANWSSGALPAARLDMQDIAVAVSASGEVHTTYRGQAVGGGGYPIEYSTCASACTLTGNWQRVAVESPGLPGSGSALQLGATGTLYHAYYVGSSTLRYAVCAGNCLQSASWQRANVDAAGSGILVSLARMEGGRTAIAYAGASGGLALATCSQGCETAASWRHGVLDLATNSGLFPNVVLDSNGQPRLASGKVGGQYIE